MWLLIQYRMCRQDARHMCTTWNLMPWNGKSFPASPCECDFVRMRVCCISIDAPREYIFFVIFITSFEHKHDIVVSQVTHSPHLHVIIFFANLRQNICYCANEMRSGRANAEVRRKSSPFCENAGWTEKHVKSEARHFLWHQHNAGKSSALFKCKRNNQICKMRLLLHAQTRMCFEFDLNRCFPRRLSIFSYFKTIGLLCPCKRGRAFFPF